MRVVIALLALLAGCYSPSFGDCEIGCAAGTCPSGLRCDNALHVCRLEGASGGCPMSDARVDTNVSMDAPPGFCRLHAGAAYCQDFDVGTIPEQGYSNVETVGSGLVSLAPSPRSPPSALSTHTPISDGSTESDARVYASVTLPSSFQSVTLAFDINVAQRDNAQLPKGEVRFEAPGFSVELNSNGPTQAYTLINDVSSSQIFDNGLAVGTWYHYEILLSAGASDFAVYGMRDGQGIGGGNGYLGNGSKPVPGPWQIGVGAHNRSSNGACTFVFDNVLVTVVP
jgi:hypothetical protein